MTSTNLVNLTKIGQLDPIPFSRDLVERMLSSAQTRAGGGAHNPRTQSH